MGNHLTPLEVLERLIGPPHAIAVACGLHEKSAFPWKRGSKHRDAGDLPSIRTCRRLLTYTKARGIPLTAEHLIWGAEASEIEALLSSRMAAE